MVLKREATWDGWRKGKEGAGVASEVADARRGNCVSDRRGSKKNQINFGSLTHQ